MKKEKLFKFLVVPSLRILSLGTISTIAASYSCSNTILQDAFVESGVAIVNYEEGVLSCEYKISVSDVHDNIAYHGVGTINFSFS